MIPPAGNIQHGQIHGDSCQDQGRGRVAEYLHGKYEFSTLNKCGDRKFWNQKWLWLYDILYSNTTKLHTSPPLGPVFPGASPKMLQAH